MSEKKIKILAVDDELFNLDIITSYLVGAGFEVIQADDGDVALQKLKETGGIDLIILDRMMPRMNGIEVLMEINKIPQFKDIPVIMQTAAASDSQKAQGIEAGVDYYLTKPYKKAALISIVQAALKDAGHAI